MACLVPFEAGFGQEGVLDRSGPSSHNVVKEGKNGGICRGEGHGGHPYGNVG